jgi:hypothetical protein
VQQGTATGPHLALEQTSPQPSLRSVLILSCHVRLSILSDRFPRVFRQVTCLSLSYLQCVLYAFYMSRPFHSSWFYHNINIWQGSHIQKLLIAVFSEGSSCILPLLSKWAQSPLGLSMWEITYMMYVCTKQLQYKTKLNSMVWVRERTIPTERPPLVGEVIANFCG